MQVDFNNNINQLYKVINKHQKIVKPIINKSTKVLDMPHLIQPDTYLMSNVMNAVLNKTRI